MRIDKLGRPYDGWDDTIEGQGNKAEAVRRAFAEEMKRRAPPNLKTYRGTLSTGGVTGKRRPYYLVRNYAGALVAIYLASFGRDLYLAWDLFVRKRVKWRNLGIMFGIAVALSLLTLWASSALGEGPSPFALGELFQESQALCTSACFVIWVIVVGAGALAAGLELHGNRYAFFVEDTGYGYQQILWRNIAIMAGLVLALTILNVYLLAWLLIIVLNALIIGKILRGAARAFFIEVMDHFAVNDTRAMVLTVDKSLRRAVDAAGLDASLLRPREMLQAGQWTRII
ncbi:MAG TPA: hypothetical protein ENJ31_04390 [Anaerolineae bacterium]|nr:hypothetical protein [Anaerolineae bacterium]